MAEAFYWFLNMNIVASLCGLVILLLRRVRRIPRRLICWLWLIPALRVLLPFGVGGRWGQFGLVGLLNRVWGRSARITGLPGAVVTNYIQTASSYDPLKFAEPGQYRVFAWGGLIWIVLACALLLTFGILYGITLRELKDARPLEGRRGVFLSEKVTGPALYGIVRPRIVLPEGEEDSPQLEHILLHEEIHRKRLDNLRRMTVFALAALCWFDPLAWLFLKCFLADLELACDEQVLARLGEEKKKEYAIALVSEEERKSLFASAFGGAAIRVRVERILSWKRMSLLACLALSVFAAALTWFLLIDPTGGVR